MRPLEPDPRQVAYEAQRARQRAYLAWWLAERALPGTPSTPVQGSAPRP